MADLPSPRKHLPMAWYIPVLIFVARICDVSIGTVRMVVIVSGHRALATVLGFVEVVIWVFAVGGTLKYLSQPLAVLAYAGGFAVGTLAGMVIEERMALGYRVVQVISPRTESEIADRLREHGHRVTSVDGHGRDGPVEIAVLVVRRRQVQNLLREIRELAPRSYVTVERVDPPHDNGKATVALRERPWLWPGLVRK
jgi:uncharacterized protein YebE (UPF0316 family)